ncbi:hypothetical protein DF16_pBMB293orf00210 (plasmid) [Bacillus thuringiensis serovar kurstaki str. YBT-1520]|nr:hypothetical protein H175_285p280 [Bacillus thuringiensis serovar thuringiensis str. IS5056]AIM34734.1 hypothetical protein DF16_pBMB293orf00210 [Bacillus thuringiensis serovar kurstaki str. YBT-1520]KEH48047.1 hypothetical protein BG09_3225 [Bacillus thuringiensis serovar kurstaki str. HD-1]
MIPRKIAIYTLVDQNTETSEHARFANNGGVSSGICWVLL